MPTTKKWIRVKGKANGISIGPDGIVFILGVKRRDSGFEIYRWSSTGEWERVNGSAVKIAIGSGGRPLILTKRNSIYWPKDTCYKNEEISSNDEMDSNQSYESPEANGKCKSIAPISPVRRSGLARSIAVGSTAWVIGTEKAPGGYGIWKRANQKWMKAESAKGAVRLAVSQTGVAYFV